MKEILQKIKEQYYFNKAKIFAFCVLLITILTCGCVFCYIGLDKDKTDEVLLSSALIANSEDAVPETKKIKVDIKGNIKNPGVYEVDYGSRVIDIINEAGGILKNSNTRYINLSKIVEDSDVIVIYTDDEIKKAKENDIIYIEAPCICEEINNACIENNYDINNGEKININTAEIDILKNLSGIGDVKAKAIVEYRTNIGYFKNIDDIKKVDGISETVFEKIKNDITV